MRSCWIILCSILFIGKLYSNSSDSLNYHQVVKDLRSELLVYDSDFSSYVPYNSEIHSGTKYITLRLDKPLLQRYSLFVFLKRGTTLFLNNKLYHTSPDNEWYKMSSTAGKGMNWLSIYNSNGDLPVNQIFYGFTKEWKEPARIESSELDIRPSHAATFQNFFIIAFVLILILLAVSKVFNSRVYSEYYNLKRNTLGVSKDQNYVFKKPLNTNNLLSLFIHCLIFTFIFFVIQYFTGGLFRISLFSIRDSLVQIIFNYFMYTVIVFIVYLIKYILISFVSYLFGLKEFKLVHYFNFIKLSMVFYIILLPLVGIVYLRYDELNEVLINNGMLFVILTFAVSKIIIITYNLNKIRQFRNLYLFSYLCATEIIPLFIVFKLLV